MVALRRGIFVTGSSLLGAAIRVPRITSKNLIRSASKRHKTVRMCFQVSRNIHFY